MKFSDLKSTCHGYRALLHNSTGRELVSAISVAEPDEPQDELHFIKLVAWCYVFVFEASQPATKFIASLLRASNPEEHRAVSLAFENVNNLRTVRVHNLLPTSKGDDYKKRQAHIWLVRNGGNSPDWVNCCGSLCREVILAVERLMHKWTQATKNVDDAAAIVGELIVTIDRDWPPHLFDRIVEGAATDIGLSGFDHVKYRDSRLERWRELVSFFETREQAEISDRLSNTCRT